MTVQMHQSYKRNRPGDICGFTPEEEQELVDKGAAVFYNPPMPEEEAEAKVEPVKKPKPDPKPEPEPEPEEEPEEDPSDLSYPKLKKAAYKKAAERGDDLDSLLPDIRTSTLLGYLQDE